MVRWRIKSWHTPQGRPLRFITENEIMWTRIVCLACLIIATLPNIGWSQSPAPTDQQIAQSRAKGVEFLKSKQLDEGSWEFPAHEVGVTALCTLALLENGVPQSDSVIEKGHRYVKKNT